MSPARQAVPPWPAAPSLPPLADLEIEITPRGRAQFPADQLAATAGVPVAILLPLSGPRAELGKAMLDAAQLAVFEIASQNFVLLPFDTKGTPEGAEDAVARALGRGAKLVLGPLLADSVEAVARQTRISDISVVAFSNSRRVAGNGVYILGFAPDQQVDAIVDYAAAQGLTSFAVLAPSNDYGQVVVESLYGSTESRGAVVTKVGYYDPAASDFSEAARALTDYDLRREELLQQMAALEGRTDEVSRQALARLEVLDTIGDPPFDAVVLPDAGQNLRTLAALMNFYDVEQPTARFLGLRAWDGTPEVAAERALQGGWFAAPPVEEREKFEIRFRAAFSYDPPRLASLAYDATALAALLAQSPRATDFSATALTDPNGFRGVDGVFRLTANGTVERNYAIYEVTPDGFRVIQPATESFQPPIN
ncbi:MAG: penicillin-binding protein activator [Rhodospirillales bacterium]|nr:MAG: penicillin-binding protein activator [Rhodospirillales bacterium]